MSRPRKPVEEPEGLVRDDGDRAGEFEVRGKTLACPICAGTHFETRRGVMDTRGMTFMGWSWANRGCTEYICRGCCYVMTFADIH